VQAGAISFGPTHDGLKSIITASGTADDESDDESATYEDSAINIDKVYRHWKTTITRRNYLN